MSSKKRPPQVLRAIREEDTETLREMGRKGGRISGERRSLLAAVRAEEKQKFLEDARAHELTLCANIPEGDR